jgi:hypothetical protein
MILNGNWQNSIRQAWEFPDTGQSRDTNNEDFLDVIWEMSQTAFDQPREIQVVVDANDELFMDFGTPGFVDFTEVPTGMTIPIKCWIHTHPFGSAYFSSTDWMTIRNWQLIMTEAIVLGDNERMVWQKDTKHTLFYRKETYLDFGQMTMDDFGMECKTSQRILQEYEEE